MDRRTFLSLSLLSACKKDMKLFNAQNKVSVGDEFFVMAGQSNCGRSKVTGSGTSQFMSAGEQTTYDKTYPYVKIINGYDTLTFATMSAGENTGIGNPQEFGAELSFFNSFGDTTTRYFLKQGAGGTNLAVQWLPPSGVQWLNIVSKIEDSVDQMIALGKSPRLKAFIWMQGEEDATNLTYANAYEANLATFFNNIDTLWGDLCTSNGLPYDVSYRKLIGLNNGQFDGSQVYNTTIQTAQTNYCSNPANRAELLDTSAFTFYDGVHYSASSQIQLGLDMYTAYTS